MMAFFSLAWWGQKLSGIAAQAIAIVIGVAVVIGGLAWLRHDAVIQERNRAAVAMEKARTAQLLVLRRKEKDAAAVGARAEQYLLRENEALSTINANLEKQLADRPSQCNAAGKVICYPKAVARTLNQ